MLAIPLFIPFQLLGMTVVYGLCHLLLALGLVDWVFITWQLGMPIFFVIAVVITGVVARRFSPC